MIHVVKAWRTCYSCPSQWEGVTDEGQYVYVRYRHGVLRIGVGATVKDAVHAHTVGDSAFQAEVGEDGNGWMSFAELKLHTAGAFRWPRSAPEGRSQYQA